MCAWLMLVGGGGQSELRLSCWFDLGGGGGGTE